MEAEYLIRKGGFFYRPNSQGYTSSVLEAGLFTLEEAIKLTHPNGPDGPRNELSYHHFNSYPELERHINDVPRAWMRRWAFDGNQGTKGNRPRGWKLLAVTQAKYLPDDVPLYSKDQPHDQ